MKKLVIMVWFAISSIVGYGQGIGDWFNQKATQTKLLVQQIAALEVYKSYLKTGYKIANTGLNTIGDFKNGEFSLHKLFFNSLKSVSPKIKQYPRIADIMLMQYEILKTYNNTVKKIKVGDGFSENDIKYCSQVFSRVLLECEDSIKDLVDVVSDGKYEMKDDERIERIDRIYTDVEDMYAFVDHFANETLQLGAERSFEKQEIDVMGQWFYKE